MVWLSPGEVTGKFYRFEVRVGGEYLMSHLYASSEQTHRGKTFGARRQLHRTIRGTCAPGENSSSGIFSLGRSSLRARDDA